MPTTFLDTAPAEAHGPAARIAPIRKPAGFVPAVQRWSFQLPDACNQLRVAFLGVQGPDAGAIARSPFMAWIADLASHPNGPTTHDHAHHADAVGRLNHVVAAYWLDDARFDRWRADVADWWAAPARLHDETGVWREVLRVPRDRQESIYWRDYPAGLMTSDEVAIYPTPYCGYYGAMRDRIALAAHDPLDAADGPMLAPQDRRGAGERWRIEPPHNLAVIRSANSWGAMDKEQHADYLASLRGPLDRGMDFLRDHPLPSGCASLRMQRTTDAAGVAASEEHALGYFLSLRHMERWAEGHASHAAIFNAAIARYKRYGASNQLRTWHEVYILPAGDQLFEYANCAPTTGLLPWFAGERVG